MCLGSFTCASPHASFEGVSVQAIFPELLHTPFVSTCSQKASAISKPTTYFCIAAAYRHAGKSLHGLAAVLSQRPKERHNLVKQSFRAIVQGGTFVVSRSSLAFRSCCIFHDCGAGHRGHRHPLHSFSAC